VQLYLRDKVASVVQPLRELRGFERVTLRPGQTRTVTFTLSRSDFSLVNAANETVVEPGEFDVWVGNSSEGGLQGSFTITG
jgi:beta-glucosidase